MSKRSSNRQKVVVVGAGPVGALAALYAASRGDDVEVYELRDGVCAFSIKTVFDMQSFAFGVIWRFDADFPVDYFDNSVLKMFDLDMV